MYCVICVVLQYSAKKKTFSVFYLCKVNVNLKCKDFKIMKNILF